MCETNIQPIYIKCPISVNLQQAYNAPPEWFELINNEPWLKLLVTPEEYISTREGSAPNYTRSFSRPVYAVKLREAGFILTLNEDNDKLRDILEEIIEKSVSPNKQEHIPIQILDCVRPNKEDKKKAILLQSTGAIAPIPEPFTVRFGMLHLEPGSGTSGFGQSRYTINGIRLIFRQTSLVA